MPFEDGTPTPAEKERDRGVAEFEKLEKARPLTKKIADEADQIAMRDPWWVWVLSGLGAIAFLVMIAIIIFACNAR